MADAPKIRIKLKAYDSRVIDAAAKQIVETALRSGASVVGPVPLPVKRSTFTVVNYKQTKVVTNVPITKTVHIIEE